MTPIEPISDEQLAELVRECRAGAEEHGGMGHDYDSCLFDRLGNALEQMQSSLRAAEADAKRYRWLRDVLRHDEKRWIGAGSWNHANIPPAEFDAAIDAAMERTP